MDPRRPLQDALAGLQRAGETDEANERTIHEAIADRAAPARQVVENAGGQAGRLE